jgi:hypothetical protein
VNNAELQNLLSQMTPWGLTIAQTGVVFLIAVALVAGWTVIRIGLQLTGILFRIGCAALLVFICGLATFMVFYNFAAK